jgi:hypothetical protein
MSVILSRARVGTRDTTGKKLRASWCKEKATESFRGRVFAENHGALKDKNPGFYMGEYTSSWGRSESWQRSFRAHSRPSVR